MRDIIEMGIACLVGTTLLTAFINPNTFDGIKCEGEGKK